MALTAMVGAVSANPDPRLPDSPEAAQARTSQGSTVKNSTILLILLVPMATLTLGALGLSLASYAYHVGTRGEGLFPKTFNFGLVLLLAAAACNIATALLWWAYRSAAKRGD
ncbi:MAG TPA: hypothetical protein VGM98_24535 [Schlesneria sp.]|jgi:hypothetical protein